MIHIYKDELDEIDIKLITNEFIKEFIKVKESRIVTFRLLIFRICLLWFIYHYCLTNFFYILPFNSPWNQLESIETDELMLAWGVFNEVLTQLNSVFWPPSPHPPLYLHVCFWATTFFPIRCVHKVSLPIFSPQTQTHMLPPCYL